MSDDPKLPRAKPAAHDFSIMISAPRAESNVVGMVIASFKAAQVVPSNVAGRKPELHQTITVRAINMDVNPACVEMLRAARSAIRALADERDFLGYQLSHAHGSIDDEQYEEIADQYLPQSARFNERDALKTAISLMILVPERADSDFIAAACRCDVDKANGLLDAAHAALKQPQSRAVRALITTEDANWKLPEGN